MVYLAYHVESRSPLDKARRNRMPSINIPRDQFPGKSDHEIAQALISKWSDGGRYFAIVRYKNSPGESQFTNFGLCEIPEHLVGYTTSPNCHGADVIWERPVSNPQPQVTRVEVDGPAPPEQVAATVQYMAGRAKQAEIQRKVEAEHANAAVRQLLQKALKEEQLEPGKGIKSLIDCFKETSASEPVDVLFKRTEHAVAALVTMGPPAVEPLISTLAEKDRFVRRAAAEALGKIRDLRAVEPLLSELESDNTPEGAVIALGDIGDRRAVDALLRALEHRDSFVRQYAAEALGQTGDVRAVEPLIVALRNKDNDSVQRSAARALGKIRDSRALSHLIATLNDRKAHEFVRTAAATALGDLGDRAAVKTLITTLADGTARGYIKNAAVGALGEIGDPHAVKPLKAILANKSQWDLHEDATTALKKIAAASENPATSVESKVRQGGPRRDRWSGLRERFRFWK